MKTLPPALLLVTAASAVACKRNPQPEQAVIQSGPQTLFHADFQLRPSDWIPRVDSSGTKLQVRELLIDEVETFTGPATIRVSYEREPPWGSVRLLWQTFARAPTSDVIGADAPLEVLYEGDLRSGLELTREWGAGTGCWRILLVGTDNSAFDLGRVSLEIEGTRAPLARPEAGVCGEALDARGSYACTVRVGPEDWDLRAETGSRQVAVREFLIENVASAEFPVRLQVRAERPHDEVRLLWHAFEREPGNAGIYEDTPLETLFTGPVGNGLDTTIPLARRTGAKYWRFLLVAPAKLDVGRVSLTLGR